MVKPIVGIVLMILFHGTVHAQYTALTPGEKVPDFTFSKIINYKDDSARVTDFRGKILILDFYALFCTPCLRKIPEMENLQKKFNDEVFILPVNCYDSIQPVAKFFDYRKSKSADGKTLPCVVYDTIASSLFPFRAVPHYVWIDKEGTFLGTSGIDKMNEATIRQVLQGKKVLDTPVLLSADYTISKPLFKNGNGGDPPLQYRSLVTGFVKSLHGQAAITTDTTAGFSKLAVTNLPLRNLIMTAYNLPLDRRNRIHFNPDVAADESSVYCYEILMANTHQDVLYDYMKEDLERYFRISVSEEMIPVKCLVIQRDKKSRKTPDTTLIPRTEMMYGNALVMSNDNFGVLVDYLGMKQEMPVLDETGYSGKISMSVPYNNLNAKALHQLFSNHGMKVVEEVRKLKMIVVRKKTKQ